MINKFITKTHYLNFINCKNAYYYSYNFPDKEMQNKKKIEESYQVKKNAYKYFNDIYDAKGDIKNIDNQIQIFNTQKLLKKNINIIANASFLYENLFCVVDILEKNDNEYNIYEIKTFTNIKSQIKKCCNSLAFQKYILNKKGFKIKNINIMYLNKNYIRHGEINVHKLFNIYNFKDNKNFKEIFNNVEKNINDIKKFNKNQLQFSTNCLSECTFFKCCHDILPKPNVTDINGIKKNKAHEFIKKNIITFEDLKKNKIKFNNYRQQVQIDAYFAKKNIINKEKIKFFLSKIKLPTYYLDFETINEAIPPFNGVSPYEQLPFQYSLHIEEKNGIQHKEFLGEKINCVYDLAKQLVKEIPVNVTVVSYNATTEKNIIKKLAKKYRNLKKHLENIANNIVDLLEPFKKGYFYNIEQNGSNSIKQVLPAICKEMKDAYNKLQINNGIEATVTFLKLFKMNKKEYFETRENLLKYCFLDTLSMIKIITILRQSIN